jgi:hypothetical protein
MSLRQRLRRGLHDLAHPHMPQSGRRGQGRYIQLSDLQALSTQDRRPRTSHNSAEQNRLAEERRQRREEAYAAAWARSWNVDVELQTRLRKAGLASASRPETAGSGQSALKQRDDRKVPATLHKRADTMQSSSTSVSTAERAGHPEPLGSNPAPQHQLSHEHRTSFDSFFALGQPRPISANDPDAQDTDVVKSGCNNSESSSSTDSQSRPLLRRE